jgi:hypothetical protein
VTIAIVVLVLGLLFAVLATLVGMIFCCNEWTVAKLRAMKLEKLSEKVF